jgi:1-acyl-sn-glycerol-3-phosphate acyltransferase
LIVKAISHLFFRFRADWLTEKRWGWWRGIRVIAILNHTSLFEPVLVAYASIPLLWMFANHGVLPVAEKTMRRNIGMFFSMLVRHVVVVTRQRDRTWDKVLNQIDRKSVVIILPEGRMKRRNGLDSHGRPMTVRGGIADILEVIDGGKMLMLYSGGLHHIQAPGDKMPRLFRTVNVRFDILDIEEYRTDLRANLAGRSFKKAVVDDLEWRRGTFCPPSSEETTVTTSDQQERAA